jgi:hypothetical protein
MMGAAASGPVNAAALDQWASTVVLQLQSSTLSHQDRARLLEGQVRHGLVNYYLDSRDRDQQKCEGRLEPVDVSELPTAQFVVYFFANTVRENIVKAGVKLPSVKIAIARALPNPTSNAYAYRHSCHYDFARRTLYIRDTRLATIGEFCVVMFHALGASGSAARQERSSRP